MAGSPDLTPSQQQAVEHFEGPLLVLAGPGSGKTRVITRRIARLIERGVPPWQILAITFTNKAAREMAERVVALLPNTRVAISTFHRFCARVLRQHAAAVGLQPNFTIFDQADQRSLLKEVLADANFDSTHFSPGAVGSRISLAKNRLQTAEDYAGIARNTGQPLDAVTAMAYVGYQRGLLAANAVDFDDLLFHVAQLFIDHPEIRQAYDERFQFVLVDEYQDTNLSQYRIVAAISQDHPNLCATGDPDQSIYGWRGAEIENILRFEADYPQTQVIRLEQNFRSTPEILQSADKLIAHNLRRKAKNLITDNASGRAVELLRFSNADMEAEGMAQRMRAEVEAGRRTWSDFAILYRVNALSRRLESTFVRQRIPYQVASGVAFYEHTEIKDLLGYLRLVVNPRDVAAFRRVVNTPKRGIGKQTVNKLLKWAERQNLDPLQAAAQANRCEEFAPGSALPLQRFAGLMAELGLADNGNVEAMLRSIIDRTSYTADLVESSEQDAQRLANIGELVAAARHYDEEHHDDASVQAFLEASSLVSDVDALNEGTERVTLLTLHAAKGLEFPVVFIQGVEQGLIPHERALKSDSPRELEEERRLLFVGMTRARVELYLTMTDLRDVRGQTSSTIMSPFLQETGLLVPRVSNLASQEQRIPPLALAGSAGEPRRLMREGRPLLMTGAALLNGTGESAEVPTSFTEGMLVRHPQMGRGRVIHAGPPGSLRTVTVEFESGETGTYVARKCPLQPIGLG